MKILLKTPLNPYSGYGNDGLGLASAVRRAGWAMTLFPSYVQPPLPREVTILLESRVDAPYDVVLHHSDPSALFTDDKEHNACNATVGWTMWESTRLWRARQRRKKLRRSLTNFDLLIGYDPISTEALTSMVNVSQRPTEVATLQGGYDPTAHPFVDRDWSESAPFRFCMVGQLHARKGPFVAIEAFKQLKDEAGPDFAQAELHLKTNIPGLHPAMEKWCPRLRIHAGNWSHNVLREFMNNCHVLLAPSRGEGKNLPCLEMLSSGGTVIATNFGGHTMWLSDEYAYPLNYELVPASPIWTDDMEASASVEHMKQLLWHTYTHRAEVRMKGEVASRVIPQMCSWDAVVDKLERLLLHHLESHEPRIDVVGYHDRPLTRGKEPIPAV